ncbi:MAG: hypothetical protein QOG28_2763 [Trebonia sp.]|nr:hypothetical protein [Trebonia sp.]
MVSALAGRVAIVTGAGRGLGRSHALSLAAAGATVVVNDLGVAVDGGDAEVLAAQQVADEICAAGGRAVADTADISTWSGSERLVAGTIDRFGRLDVLVNNAGILRDGAIADMAEGDLDAVLAVHLKGTFGTMRHAVAYWRGRTADATGEHRRVINTTSPSGLFSIGNANYCAAKAGVAALTALAAREFAPFGVAVNAVAPRALTRMTEDIPRLAAGANSTAGGLVPYAPEHVSRLVTWLAGDHADDVSGHVFLVYGGFIGLVDGWTTGPVARSERAWSSPDLDEVVSDLVRRAAPAAGLNGERPAKDAITAGTQ